MMTLSEVLEAKIDEELAKGRQINGMVIFRTLKSSKSGWPMDSRETIELVTVYLEEKVDKGEATKNSSLPVYYLTAAQKPVKTQAAPVLVKPAPVAKPKVKQLGFFS